MPSIPLEERKHMLGPDGSCGRCQKERVKHYCRSCDVFFFACGCQVDEAFVEHLVGHRIYLWTTDGVIPYPDYDALLSDPR